MICPRCSRQLPDGTKFCDGCGFAIPSAPQPGAPAPAPRPAPAPGYQQPNYGAPPPPPNYNQGYQQPMGSPFGQGHLSEFTGGIFDTFVAVLAASLLITITCGFATPWAITNLLKFIFGHTRIDGKRLVFVGNGAEFFGQWVIWSLLSLITCGIYGIFVVTPRLFNWIAKNTHFQD